MDDINKGFIIGRLVRDAELSYTQSGYAMAKMSLASSKSKKVGDSWQDESHFFDLVMWGKRAESLQQYLTKGQQVGVQYSLTQDRWEKDGQKRSKVTLTVDNIQLLGGKKDTSNYTPQRDNAISPEFQQNNNNYTPPYGTVNDQYEEDIPF
jgi:single-strand DNA-binding protein